MTQDRHSATFAIFHRAILDRKQMSFSYDGYRGLPPSGQWRCFDLARVRDITTLSGPWHSGSQHRSSQHCVDDVYVDINTDVPNQPGRSGINNFST
jgi:predicted DNA-binding transcriptional regulator YafY